MSRRPQKLREGDQPIHRRYVKSKSAIERSFYSFWCLAIIWGGQAEEQRGAAVVIGGGQE